MPPTRRPRYVEGNQTSCRRPSRTLCGRRVERAPRLSSPASALVRLPQESDWRSGNPDRPELAHQGPVRRSHDRGQGRRRASRWPVWPRDLAPTAQPNRADLAAASHVERPVRHPRSLSAGAPSLAARSHSALWPWRHSASSERHGPHRPSDAARPPDTGFSAPVSCRSDGGPARGPSGWLNIGTGCVRRGRRSSVLRPPVNADPAFRVRFKRKVCARTCNEPRARARPASRRAAQASSLG